VIRIRLHALPEDTARTAARLADLFEILEDSGDRPTRGASRMRLRYLTVRPIAPQRR
jgi:hypothetical protein